jgi:hypothetical protein
MLRHLGQESRFKTFLFIGEALDVETVELFSWNELPRFLRDINPALPRSGG